MLVAMHPIQDPIRLEADVQEYFELSGQVMHGSYHFDSRRVPGHVLILAVFRKLTSGNLIALQVLVSIFFSLVAPFVYLLARRFSPDKRLAFVVALAATVWPPFLIYGRTLYSETTALPCFIAFLFLLPRGLVMGGNLAVVPTWRWIISGFMFGICLLIRPMYLIFTPFLIIIICIENNFKIRVLTSLLWLGLGCAITLLPWTLYASQHAGRFVLLSSNGGETLAGGLNPNLIARGYTMYTTPEGRVTWAGPGKWSDELDTGYLSPQELQWPREARDHILMKRTCAWAWTHPKDASYLEWAKLAYMWGVYPFWNGLKQTLFGNIPTLFLVIVNLLGLFVFRQRLSQFVMLCALPLFSSAVALISWGSWRFRQPGDIGLLMLAFFLLWTWISKKKVWFYGDPLVERDSRDEGKGKPLFK